MDNQRIGIRTDLPLIALIRVEAADGGYSIHQFITKNVSITGLFIASDDLTLFELGSEIELMLDSGETRYYEGKAKIVRSARVFVGTGKPTDSGYGLLLLDISDDFKEYIQQKVEIE